MSKAIHKALIIGFLLLLSFSESVMAERIKDLAVVAGVRSNQLIGYGLIVGLNGTGDQNSFTKESFSNMLKELGVNLPAGDEAKSKNVAAVMVTAVLPAFSKPGQNIDITVASIGDAKSLRGGTLLMVPLKGADGQVYALAQGNVIAGGVSAFGGDDSSVTVNVPSSGRIPGGATVERMVNNPFADGDSLFFNLHTADFSTAKRVADAVNRMIGPGSARPLDSMTIKVNAPREISQRVRFLAALENIEVMSADGPARIVVNSRSGTIVIGQHVTVTAAAVAHGSLTVTISESNSVSQPNPLSDGETQEVKNSNVAISEEENNMFIFNRVTSLNEIVRAINSVGAAPGDMMAILEALKAVGALKAELLVI